MCASDAFQQQPCNLSLTIKLCLGHSQLMFGLKQEEESEGVIFASVFISIITPSINSRPVLKDIDKWLTWQTAEPDLTVTCVNVQYFVMP